MNSGISKEGIKAIRKLHDHKGRADKGLFLIEGVRLLWEAVKEGALLEEVLYTRRLEETGRGKAILAELIRRKAPVIEVKEKDMEVAAGTETSQGILAVVRQLKWGFKDIITRDKGHAIIACGLQDPGNLGTIIRTADAGGASGVIAAGNTVDIYNLKVVRATMGSIFRLPVLKLDVPLEAVSTLKKESYQIAAATARSKTSYLDIDYRKPTAFLIGQEASGLPDDVLESADIKVFIPMKEGVESLNAAVSASILIYEAFRQKMMQRSLSC